MQIKYLRLVLHASSASYITWCLFTVYFILGPLLPQFTGPNFFSFFTIQSNILASIFFLFLSALLLSGREASWRRRYGELRSMLMAYMGITTGVYWLLLHRFFNIADNTARLANMSLHSIAFIVLAIDFALSRPQEKLPQHRAFVWLVYPLLYTVYTFIRGAFIGWHPYPYMDTNKLGYLLVISTSCLMLVAMFGFFRLVIGLHNRCQSF